MKSKFFVRLLSFGIALAMMLALMLSCIEKGNGANAASGNTLDSQGYSQEESYERKGLTMQLVTEAKCARVADQYYKKYYNHDYYLRKKDAAGNAKEKKEKKAKEELANTMKAVSKISEELPGIITAIKTAAGSEDGRDADKAAAKVVSLASDIASLCGPQGQAVGAALDGAVAIFKLVKGGAEPVSELELLADNLNSQFDELKGMLDGINEEIRGLSEEVTVAAQKVVTELKSYIDDKEAQETLTKFMGRTEGNFSYLQYKNYLVGLDDSDNAFRNTAYKSALDTARANGSSSEVVKANYDALYSAVISNMDQYYDYIVPASGGKSIVQCYYDVLRARPDLIAAGETAETQAILFASDLFDTEIAGGEALVTGNLFQLMRMLCDGKDIYTYGSGATDFVTRDRIENGDIMKQVSKRIDAIELQMAKDVAYILNVRNFYLVKEGESPLYEIYNNDAQTFAHVTKGQTIYLYSIPEAVCNLLYINGYDFSYTVDDKSSNGFFTVERSSGTATAALSYRGEKVSEIVFSLDDGESAAFRGGSGTEADPYRISNPSQFWQIENGMDKHYCLIKDLDFGSAAHYPISGGENGFCGAINGNGCTIKNLSVVSGGAQCGLFEKIGVGGRIENLNFYNVKSSCNIGDLGGDTSVYGGIIAGLNCGTISGCHIDSDGTTETWTEVCGEQSLFKSEGTDLAGYRKRLAVCTATYAIGGIAFVPHYGILVDYYNSVKKPESTVAPRYGVSVKVSNANKNRNISVYAGGVVGNNAGTISLCSINNIKVFGTTEHSFAGELMKNNKNDVTIGGVCGRNAATVERCSVKSAVKLSAIAKSNFDNGVYLKPIKPYATAVCGGIAGSAANDSTIENVYSAKSFEETALTRCVLHNKANVWSLAKDHMIEEANNYAAPNDKSTLTTTDNENIADNGASAAHTIACDYSGKTLYPAGESFDYNSLTLTVDGTEIERYDAANETPQAEYYQAYLYGFNTQNKAFDHTQKLENVTAVFVIRLSDGSTLYHIKQLGDFTVEANRVLSEYSAINYINSEYKISGEGGFNAIGLSMHYEYAVDGVFDVEITKELITGTQNGEVSSSTTPDSIGIHDMTIEYRNDTDGVTIVFPFQIKMVCDHKNNPFGDIYDEDDNGHFYEVKDESGDYWNIIEEKDRPRAPTCTEIGWRTFYCTTENCKCVRKHYIPATGHYLEYTIDTPATCYETGTYGEIACKVCDYKETAGTEQPRLPHKYVSYENWTDADGKTWDTDTYPANGYHRCANEPDNGGAEYERHQFRVTETVEYVSKEGVDYLIPKVCYVYTCCHEHCGYTYKVYDDNIDLTKSPEYNLPAVVVSDGYAVKGGTEVVVYVQLINNEEPIIGASFGIRYSERLQLLHWEYGSMLKHIVSITKDSIYVQNEVRNGYNFAWVDTTLENTEGNLLKLVFRVPENAVEPSGDRLGEAFNVSVVYAGDDSGTAFGGFSVKKQANAVRFITRDGTIRMVKHLPGDVNDDGRVNLMDVVSVGKHIVTEYKYPINTKYADVDLDNIIYITDMRNIMLSICGGYGADLLSPSFLLTAKTGDYIYEGDDLGDQIVNFGETNYSLPDWAEQRQGYKFLGWYTRPYGGTEVVSGTPVTYDKYQKKQTVYAQWELNQIIFDGGAASNADKVTMSVLSYTEGTENYYFESTMTFEKKYNIEGVLVYSKYASGKTDNGTYIDGKYTWTPDTQNIVLFYEFLGWYGDRGEGYSSFDINNYLISEHNGTTKLTAKWGEPSFKQNECDFSWNVPAGYNDTIAMYSDIGITLGAEVDSIIPLRNKNKRINQVADIETSCADIETSCKVFFIFDPITYSIEFELYGADTNKLPGMDESFTFDPRPADSYSIEKPYTMKATSNNQTTEFIPTDGFNLSQCSLYGWEDSKGNPYPPEKNTYGYIAGAQQDDTVTIKARWESKLDLSFDEESGGYVVTGIKDYALTGDTGTGGSLYIPECVYLEPPKDDKTKNGLLPITKIADNAFQNNGAITEVNMFGGVTSIGANAFSGCPQLERITIGKNVTTIGDNAFSGCKDSVRVRMPATAIPLISDMSEVRMQCR